LPCAIRLLPVPTIAMAFHDFDNVGKLVDQTVASWNRIEAWLRHISGLREAA
jgi:hypothetical protein